MTLTKDDLQAIQGLLTPINSRLDSMDSRLDSLEESQTAIRKSILKIELEQLPRITAALDGVASGMEKNKEQDRRLFIVEDRVEEHDHRIVALERKAE